MCKFDISCFNEDVCSSVNDNWTINYKVKLPAGWFTGCFADYLLYKNVCSPVNDNWEHTRSCLSHTPFLDHGDCLIGAHSCPVSHIQYSSANFTQSCRMSLARQSCLNTRPNHLSLHYFTTSIKRSFSQSLSTVNSLLQTFILKALIFFFIACESVIVRAFDPWRGVEIIIARRTCIFRLIMIIPGTVMTMHYLVIRDIRLPKFYFSLNLFE